MIVDEGRKAPGLVSTFEDGGAEMDVVDVEQRAVTKIHVRPLARSLLAGAPRQVVVPVMDDRMAAEDDVAELMLPELSHRVHHPAHPERGADLRSLIDSRRTRADDFLQRDHIGVQLADHVGNARRDGAAVHAPASVNVVGRDPHVNVLARLVGHCCRSRIHTNGPTTFSHSGRRSHSASVTSSLSVRSRS